MALILCAGELVIGTLHANANGGDFPHCYGCVQQVPDSGHATEFYFLGINLIDQA
jgi:hypothetical protein